MKDKYIETLKQLIIEMRKDQKNHLTANQDAQMIAYDIIMVKRFIDEVENCIEIIQEIN